MITGKDDRSLLVLQSLKDGLSVTTAAAQYSLSLDQVKRLSRYCSILQSAESNLSSSAFTKIQAQGLKVLYIADLFKRGDWLGLEEILDACDDRTTRDDLKHLVHALELKRERDQTFQHEADRSAARLEEQANQLSIKEDECRRLKAQIDASLRDFDKYGTEMKAFIVEHVGLVEGRYCLKRRVDSLWFQDLKKSKLVIYDELNYCYLIQDLDRLIEAIQQRLKRRGNVLWDEEREFKRWEKRMDSGFGSYYEFPNSPYYKNGHALVAEDLNSQLRTIEEKIGEIRKEQEEIKLLLQAKKKTSIKSFMEAVEARNTLSLADLRSHGELQQKAMRWLFNQGYVAASEVVLDNGRRVDVIGYNKDHRIIIIEVKVSRNDLLSDDKWINYLDACDDFYFCLPRDTADWISEKNGLNGKSDAGLLRPVQRGYSLEVAVPSSLNPSAENREVIIFSIARTLSKKYTFGF